MFGLNNELRQVIEISVERFSNDGEQEPVDLPLLGLLDLDGVLVDSLVCGADGEGVGDDNGGVQQTSLVDPMAARHLPRAVEGEQAGVARLLEPVRTGEN